MSGAALMLTGATIGTPGAPRARFRLQHPLAAQIVRYAIVGGSGTVLTAVLFLLLRTWWDALPANLAALVLSTVVGTEVNRRFTFDDAPVHPWRAHLQTVGTVLFYAFYSSAVLMLLVLVIDAPTPLQESLVVAVASLVGGSIRFLVLRQWVFHEDDEPAARPTTV